MIHIEFDDLIYSLQAFGGARVYWNEVTSRVQQDVRFRTTRNQPSRSCRAVPARSRADVFHSSHFRTNLGRAKTVSTVHDMNYELGYVAPGLGARLNLWERKASYFTADALICISRSTRKELLDVYPQLERRCPVYVIHHGFSDLSQLGGAAPALPFDEYVLYVGARASYKRFGDVLHGFHASMIWKDGVRLLCTGNEFDAGERAEIASLGLADFVTSAGKVDPATLGALYRHAHCLVYASVHEGFGLPLLEAMSSGCPVVACDISCIPEVVGDAAILVAPRSPEDIASALMRLQDTSLRQAIVAKGRARAAQFSWQKSAQAHMDIYLNIAGRVN